MTLKKLTLASAVSAVAALTVPLAAHAESNFNSSGGANITASARVDFSVTIPKFVFLQVGTGTMMADNGTIDVITVSVPAASIGNSTPIAATGGNLTGGSVTVVVRGNNGDMTLASTSPAALSNGSGDNIAWTQIATATAGGTAHPTINGAALPYTATGKVVNASGTWTYSYLNQFTQPPGVYTGQVTYTATTP